MSPRSRGKGIRPGLPAIRALHNSASGSLASVGAGWKTWIAPASVATATRPSAAEARRRRVLARGWSGPTESGGVDSAAADWISRTTSDGIAPAPVDRNEEAIAQQHGGAEIAPGSWPDGKTWRQRRPGRPAQRGCRDRPVGR